MPNTTFQTRIQLKYDTYANWTANNPVLLVGEMALATVASGDNGSFQNLPNVVAKIGDGSSHYNDLKFLSGLAADVYDWAKAAQKPTYAATEITGLTEFVEGISDIDTNTQYQLVAVDGSTFKYQLQKKDIGDADWSNVSGSVIDFSGVDTRLSSLEATVGGLTGDAGGIQGAINKAIEDLSDDVSQEAGADGLALNVVQESGHITSISGSIKAGTYDAYGSAKAVDDKLTAEVTRATGAEATLTQGVADNKAAIEKEVKDRDDAIKALDYTGYAAGTATGTTISFVGTISETDGVIAAEKRDLVFNSAYDPTTNKAATMADITQSVADLTGAMHYRGTVESDPTATDFDKSGYKAGDVIIYGIKEYIFDGTKFDELGDEGAAAALIAGLKAAAMACDADSTVSEISEANGIVSAKYQKIQIAETQVSGLTDKLATMSKATADGDAALDTKIAANAEAIATLNGEKTVTGSVAQKIDAAVNSLTAGKDQTAGADGLALHIKQEGGIITELTGSIKAGTYDAAGAAAAVLGKEADASTANTVYGAKKAAAEALAAAQAANDKATNTLKGVSATVEATAESSTDHTFGVLTKVVQTDGALIPDESSEVILHKVAKSGKIDDLDQTAYIIFNCGTSSVNI